ncbi:hypothetical protein P8452_73275 [Trifolium repens]|nr:hypothetical protein P8452_73275 [Trifolium repens]
MLCSVLLSHAFTHILCRCDPVDSPVFKDWITKGMCPANPMILRLFKTLIERGFKVFLLTGRYEETLAKITMDNLHNEGFIGYQHLIVRDADDEDDDNERRDKARILPYPVLFLTFLVVSNLAYFIDYGHNSICSI